MQNNVTPTDRPANALSALRTEPERKPEAEQRIADAAAKRPAPVDQAQVSPQARQLEANEKPADASREQQASDQKLEPVRQQIRQQQDQVSAQKRFEVVA